MRIYITLLLSWLILESYGALGYNWSRTGDIISIAILIMTAIGIVFVWAI